jgi:hypothetical protein
MKEPSGITRKETAPIAGYPGRSLIVVAAIVAMVLIGVRPGASGETTQEHIHRMSHHVMPFEMGKTIHIFKMTELGGVMRVLTRAPDDADQVTLIRRHLRHEAERFKQGDYADPAQLHGADMPGLVELQANPSAVEVSYKALPNGAEIRFKTNDLRILTAIHRWFGAQLSEHGADARAE